MRKKTEYTPMADCAELMDWCGETQRNAREKSNARKAYLAIWVLALAFVFGIILLGNAVAVV